MKWLFYLFSLSCVLATPAFSQERDVSCHPTWATSDLPITRNIFRSWSSRRNEPVAIGPRLDANMYYWDRGTLFRLPYGFFNPWFLSQTGKEIRFPELDEYLSNLAKYSANTGYDASTGLFNPNLLERKDVGTPLISFWMPSLRYVEQNMRTAYDFRPCEPGREPPSEGEYVVQFRIEWPGSPNIEQLPQIERFENARQRPSANPAVFDHFGNKFFVTLVCSSGGCVGWIWEKERDVIIHIQFPDHLRQENPEHFWREPAGAAFHLIESWKINEEMIDAD